jgi:hypothetical protein
LDVARHDRRAALLGSLVTVADPVDRTNPVSGDTSCAADTRGASGNPFGAASGQLQLQGVGRFPLTARAAIAAKRAHGDASPALARRAAAVAATLRGTLGGQRVALLAPPR